MLWIDDVELECLTMQIPQRNDENKIYLGYGDSYLVDDLLPNNGANYLESLLSEISFKEMRHRGGVVPRLVDIQGQAIEIERGNYTDGTWRQSLLFEPIYRYPSEDDFIGNAFTPTVIEIKKYIEDKLDQKFNHVLIQLYRGGEDFINEHADKTLDILRGSNIVNFSLGASRTLFLKPKRDSPHKCGISGTQKIVMPHNSLFVCGWNTNIHFVHGIKPDRKRAQIKIDDEVLYDETRISLTFRNIATHHCRSLQLLIGQGARRWRNVSSSYPEDVMRLVADLEPCLDDLNCHLDQASIREQSIRLIEAFSVENKSALFNWENLYGEGFDITRIEI